MSEVRFYCDDVSHAERMFVREFRQQERSSGYDLATGNVRARWFEVEPRSRPRKDRSTVLLDGDKPVGHLNARGLGMLEGSGFRATVRLVCPTCERRPVPVRWERLEPILDTLAANILTEMTLNQLEARLRRS